MNSRKGYGLWDQAISQAQPSTPEKIPETGCRPTESAPSSWWFKPWLWRDRLKEKFSFCNPSLVMSWLNNLPCCFLFRCRKVTKWGFYRRTDLLQNLLAPVWLGLHEIILLPSTKSSTLWPSYPLALKLWGQKLAKEKCQKYPSQWKIPLESEKESLRERLWRSGKAARPKAL